MEIKKVLKFLSNFLAGILFTISFFLLFTSVFVSGLIENLPVLESSLQDQLFDKGLILEQIAKESGLTQQQIIEICKQDPNQLTCEQIESPGLTTKPIIDEINNQISPYKPFIDNSKFLAALFFVLSIVFYFIGTMSIYVSLFKISVNTLISSAFGFITIISFPKIIPGVVDQAFNITSADISSELPANFKENLIIIINEWFNNPIAELKTLFIYIITVSLLASVVFYFLKRKVIKSNSNV